MAVSKDLVEARAFQIFWKCFVGGVLTKAQIDAKRPTKDPPDFEFDFSQKHIAIEHTRLENRGPGLLEPSHEFAIKTRIWDRIRELLETDWAGMPPLTMSIQFVSCRDIKKPKDEDSVARGVLKLVRDRLNQGDRLPIHFFMSDLQPVSSCLGDLQVAKDDGPSSTIFHFLGSAVVDESGLGAIQKAAQIKAKDLCRYAGNFDECWLLLDACGPDPSRWIEPSLHSQSLGIRTPFARVFVVTDAPEKMFEIAIHG